ncbi:MAG: biopolymer transport protein ExbD [Polaribacter sp.]|jgi:biopolymer transport protein ExbD
MKKRKRRLPSEINAGSMADIAFLLLIFFLVATTILEDQGILVRLPPWSDVIDTTVPVRPRNLLPIKINAKGLLLVGKEETKITELRDIAKEFITNPMKRLDLPSSPNKAVISLQNDRGTAYKYYLSVYNEIKGAYNEVWTERAQEQFQKAYAGLTRTQQKSIRSQWPQIISEAEPTAYAEVN